MNYAKHLLIIRDVQYDIGDNITIQYDLDNMFTNLSLTMPYIKNEQFDTTIFRDSDRVQLFYGLFSDASSANNATIDDLTKIFDGYIDKLPRSISKTNGWQYSLQCKSRLALSFERPSRIPFVNNTIRRFLEQAFNNADLTDFVTNLDITGVSENFTVKLETTNKFGEALQQIKDKYALHIFDKPDNTLKITTPFFLSRQSTVDAFQFKLDENMFSFNQSDKNAMIDCVIVVGTNCVGVAFDPIGYQLRFGKRIEDLVPNPRIEVEQLRTKYEYRRDVFSQVDAQELARNLLVDKLKANNVTFDTIFKTEYELGAPFVIQGVDKIPDNQLWIMKSITFNLSKGSNTCTIVGYSNSVIDFPGDILLSEFGLLNTNILQTTQKVEKALNIRG